MIDALVKSGYTTDDIDMSNKAPNHKLFNQKLKVKKRVSYPIFEEQDFMLRATAAVVLGSDLLGSIGLELLKYIKIKELQQSNLSDKKVLESFKDSFIQ